MKIQPLPVGTNVIAIQDIGPVKEGAPGIITSVMETGFFFWKRIMYLCTFFGGVKLAVRPSEINDFEHGYARELLEKPKDDRLPVADQLQRVLGR